MAPASTSTATRAASRTAVPERRRPVLALLLAAAASGPATAQAVTQLTTPDGSRFVLCADANVPQLQWAVASWTNGADDPTGFPGLARIVLQQSMLGTWSSGSRDPAAERLALEALEDGWQQCLQRPGDAAAMSRVQELDRAASALADPVTFHRVLAALPAHRPELLDQGAVGVFVLTTLPSAIADVGAMLVERREESALRELHRAWIGEMIARGSRPTVDPFQPLRTELLALAMPSHPLTRQLDVPSLGTPRRADALATWVATQHPTRTVHVLLGDFDAAAAAKILQTTFVRTQLPPPPPLPASPRPFTGQRRSVVPGASAPSVALAWPVPTGSDPRVLEIAAQWLAGGADSRVGQALARANRAKVQVGVRAPWPPTDDGRALFVVEVRDEGGARGLADAVQAACRDAMAVTPTPASMQSLQATMQREWRDRCGDARQQAAAMAAQALQWPSQPPLAGGPRNVDPAAVQRLLQTMGRGPSLLVEGQP